MAWEPPEIASWAPPESQGTPASVSSPLSASPESISAPQSPGLDAQQEEFLSKPGVVSSTAPQGALKSADIDALAPSVVEPYALDNSNINYDDPEVLKKQMEDPLLSLPKPQGKGIGAGVVRGLETAAEGLTSRTNIALMLSLGGAPAAIQKVAALGFGTMMAKDIPEKIVAGKKALDSGDSGGAAEAWTGAAIDTLLAAATIGHAGAGRGEVSPAELKAKQALRSKGLTQEQVDSAFQRIKDADPNALRNASDQAINALVKDTALRKTLPYSEQEIEAEVARRAALPPKAPAPVQPVVKTFLRGQEVVGTPESPATATTEAEPPLASQPTPGDVRASSIENTGSLNMFQRLQREQQAARAVAPLKVAAEAARQDAPAAAAAAENAAEELKAKALTISPEPEVETPAPEKKADNKSPASKMPIESPTIYRAASTPEAKKGAHFSENEADAKSYQDNPGFGGPNIYKFEMESGDVSDVPNLRALSEALEPLLDEEQKEWVDERGGLESVMREHGFTTVFHALENSFGPRRNAIDPAELLAKTHNWIRFDDDFPEGAKTLRYLGNKELRPISEPGAKIVGPAITDEQGKVLSKGEIGTNHGKLKASEISKGNVDAADASHVFLDDKGNVLNREQAWELAKKAGQIPEETLNAQARGETAPELHSEHLTEGAEKPATEPVETSKPAEIHETVRKKLDDAEKDLADDEEAAPPPKQERTKEETIAALKGELEQAIKDKRTRDTGPLRKRIKALESEPKETTEEPADPQAERPKEIWQKTREEAKSEGILAKHRLAVKEAVARGKPVPLDVLEGFGGSKWAEDAIVNNYGGVASDSLLSKVEKALEDDPNKMFVDPLLIQTIGKPILRQMVKGIRASLEAGKLGKDAVEDAMTFLRGKVANFDENKARAYAEQLVNPETETKGGEISEERNQKGNEEKGEVTQSGEGEAVQSQSPEPETTAAYNAETDKVLERGGFAPIAKEASKELGASWQEALDSVKSAADKGQDIGANLVKELNKKPRALTDVESGVLLNELAVRKKAQALLQEQLEADAKSGDEAAQAETAAQLAVARDKTFETIQAAKIAGREWGRAGRFRQIHIDDDYNIVSMEAKVRAEVNNGKPLTEEQQKSVKASAEEIEKAKKYDEMMESARRDAETATIADNLQKQVKEQAEQNAAKGKTFIDFIHDQAAKARARIIARRGSMFMAVEPITPLAARFVDETIIGASYIADKIVDFSRWSKKMVADFGPRISPHLPEIFKLASEKNDELSGEHETQNNPEKTPEKTVKNIVAKQAGKPLNPQAVYELAKAHAQMGVGKKGGVEGMNELMKAVHKDLEPSNEGLTERQVRDAFSGYGKVQHPSKEAVASQLREVRRLGQLQSGIEDALNKQAPKKSGMQRDKPTQAIREQMKKLQVAMQEAGIETTSPEQQLASVNAARERSISNRIEDIKKEIATGEKPPKGKTVADNPKVTELKAERDRLQKQLDEINEAKNPKKTPEQVQNERYRTLIAKRLSDLQARMDAKDFAKPVRNKLKLDKESEQAKADYERAKQKFDTEVEKQRRSNLPASQKFWNHFVSVERAGKLTSAAVFGKLGVAAAAREFVLTPAEEAIGGAISKALPGLADRAPREGGFSTDAELKAKSAMFTQGMKDAWENLKMKKSNLDALNKNKMRDVPPAWYEYMGFLHSALKAPVKRAEFTRSLAKRMAFAEKEGRNINDPNTITELSQEAYADANRAIFMQDNAVAKAFSGATRIAEFNNAAWLSRTLKFFVPIVKVPTNIIGEAYTGATGLATGSVKAALAYKRGIENLPPAEADAIMRQLKKGSIGASALLLGYFSSKNVGGFYRKEDQRGDSEVKAGQYRIGGEDMPKWFGHTPVAMLINIGATVRRTEEEREAGGGKKGKLVGAVEAGKGFAKEIPFVPVITNGAEALDSERGFERWIQGMVSSTVLPSIVPQVARSIDTPGTYPKNIFEPARSRQPAPGIVPGIKDALKLGIPGLREQVPLKKPKPKRRYSAIR